MSMWTKIFRPVVSTVARGVAAYYTGGASEMVFAHATSGGGRGVGAAVEPVPFTDPPLKVRIAQYALRTAAGIPVLGAVIGPLSDKFDEAQQAAQEGEDAVADMLRVDNVEPADDEYFDDEGYDEEF